MPKSSALMTDPSTQHQTPKPTNFTRLQINDIMKENTQMLQQQQEKQENESCSNPLTKKLTRKFSMNQDIQKLTLD